MRKCKILIADDEKLAREAIKLQLKTVGEVAEVVAECIDGREAATAINKHQPDIVFLDIQMPYLTGLEVVHQFRDDYSPYVIFVTAYDTYALQAFESNAVDYLVKPFTEQRFLKAFQKAYKVWKASSNQEEIPVQSWEQIKQLLKSLTSEETKTTLPVKSGSKTFVVCLDEIIYIESAGNYTLLITPEKKYLHKETLQNLEETLPSSFARIHKSVIVNTSCIKEFHSLLSGDYIVKLKTGQELKLSRNYRNRLAHLL